MQKGRVQVAGTKSILTPSMTLKGHGLWIRSISYFPDGQRMIGGSYDKTTRQWDLKAGKETKEVRDVCEEEVWAVAVSRGSRWVVIGGGDHDRPELKAREVETGTDITRVDISADNTLLARLQALGPFESFDLVDSKRLAVKSIVGKCLEVWVVQWQALDLRRGEWKTAGYDTFACTQDDDATTIYEFDATSFDDTIKLWAFESRQLLASFDVQNPRVLILSPNSCQLAYTSYAEGTYKICICDTPPGVLAQAIHCTQKPALSDLLNSDATRHFASRHRRPPIHVIPMVQRPPPTIDPQQPVFIRLSKLFRFSPRTKAVRPGRNDQPRDPLDFSATLPLPRPLSGHTSFQGRSHMNSGENVSFDCFPSAQTPIVDVPLAQAKERNAAAGAPKKDKDIVPIEYLDPRRSLIHNN
ncbi:hypothetical protein BDR05DRAFT_960260 [Suillus weaverae]|nr:hypothetical protein BDR05DRAFT_960260 [Suillus weaverae]